MLSRGGQRGIWHFRNRNKFPFRAQDTGVRPSEHSGITKEPRGAGKSLGSRRRASCRWAFLSRPLTSISLPVESSPKGQNHHYFVFPA